MFQWALRGKEYHSQTLLSCFSKAYRMSHASASSVTAGPPESGETSKEMLDKKALRKQIKQVLLELTQEELDRQSIQAFKILADMREYKDAQSISIFLSMPKGEIDTRPVVRDALASGKHVYIPYIYKPELSDRDDLPASIMDMVQLDSMQDFASLAPDKWGIPSIYKSSVDRRQNCFGMQGLSHGAAPRSGCRGLDMIVMPSVAFDHSMNRLGHGKGYYDNFLTRYCSKTAAESDVGRRKPLLVGYALDRQLLPSDSQLPTEAWDWKVDRVVVGSSPDGDAKVITS